MSMNLKGGTFVEYQNIHDLFHVRDHVGSRRRSSWTQTYSLSH